MPVLLTARAPPPLLTLIPLRLVLLKLPVSTVPEVPSTLGHAQDAPLIRFPPVPRMVTVPNAVTENIN